ncbi:MAG: response regulator [Spirochaetia bacterium]|nr:response regulator [Spirochaetia bacterium]
MRRNGAVFPAELSVTQYFHNGEVFFCGVLRDLSGLAGDRPARQSLSDIKASESEDRFKAQYEYLPIPTYIWRKTEDDWEFVDYNRAAEALTGGQIAGIHNARASELYADSPVIRDAFDECYQTKKAVHINAPYAMRSTGDIKNLSIVFSFVPPDLIQVCTEDITDKLRAMAELRASEQRYRQIAESSPKGIIDRSQIEEKLHRTIKELDFFKYALDKHSVVATADLNGIITYVNDKFCEKDGTFYWVDTTIVRVTGDRDAPAHYISIHVDTTERKRTEEALNAAKEAAEAANDAKSMFLANMSHEIRTPMNAIVGFADLLLDTPLGELQRNYMEIISSAGKSLLTIISDILDFSKIEANKIELESQPTDVAQMVRDVERILFPAALDKRITVKLNLPANLPDVSTDSVRLKQVLLNLGSNAIKFTDRGHVLFDVTALDQTASHITLRFSVSDTGTGISKDKQLYLFRPFTQFGDLTTKKTQGTGLGLAISKKIIEMFGGTISVHSTEGAGATFSFVLTLPIFSRSKPPAQEIEADRLPYNLKILLAEDNPVNQMLAVAMLGDHTVTAVGDGRAALDALEKGVFDLVFLDLQMPELDGIAVARIIRDPDSEVRDHHTPIIALTAYATKETHDRCLDAGMNGYVTKPISRDALRRILTQIHSARG